MARPATLRVVSYNILGARYAKPLAAVVRALEPDVLVVNETPKVPLVWPLQCDALASAWGMRRAAGGRSAGSNMICVSERVQVLGSSARRLRQPRFKPRRGIVTLQGAFQGVEFGVVGVHLSLIRVSHPTETAAALADAARLRGAVLMCGDLNERPREPAWAHFESEGFVDRAPPGPASNTSTAVEPVKRIDALLVRGADVVRHEVPLFVGGDLLGRASDHLPVLVEVTLSPPASLDSAA